MLRVSTPKNVQTPVDIITRILTDTQKESVDSVCGIVCPAAAHRANLLLLNG